MIALFLSFDKAVGVQFFRFFFLSFFCLVYCFSLRLPIPIRVVLILLNHDMEFGRKHIGAIVIVVVVVLSNMVERCETRRITEINGGYYGCIGFAVGICCNNK